jgi:hypothetical protein
MRDTESPFLRRSTRKINRFQQRFRIFITVIFAAVACSVVIIALRARVVAVPRSVEFDPAMVVRVGDISTVYAIRQDPRHPSWLWFATAQGVHVLDRATGSWRRYGADHGLPSERCYEVCFFRGRPAVATRYGPALLDASGERFRAILPGDTVEAMAMAAVGDSMLVFSAHFLGLYAVFGADTSEPVPLDVPGLKRTHTVTCLRALDSSLYVGTEVEELYRYDPRRGTSVAIGFPARFDGNAQILDITSRKGVLWVSTSYDGVLTSRSGADSLEFVHEFPCKGAYALSGDRDGMWTGTPWGLWRYLEKQNVWMQMMHPKERAPGDFQVSALFSSDSSMLWYGAMESGMGTLGTTKRVLWTALRGGPAAPNVCAIACTDSAVFTGYGYRGEYIDRFDLSTMQYRGNVGWNAGVGDPHIQSLATHGPLLYYGGFDGFGYVNTETGKTRWFTRGKPLQAYDITCMIPSAVSCVLGTAFGIAEYFPGADSFSMADSTRLDRVTCMMVSGDSLWYGTLARGLKLLNRRTGAVTGPWLSQANRIVGIARLNPRPDSMRLFVATDRAGCFMLDPLTGVAVACEIPEDYIPDGLEAPDNELEAMAVMDSLIWLGSSGSGCIVYDPATKRWGSFTYYEGLLTDQVRTFYQTPRHIYVGCFGGVTRIDRRYPRLREAIFGVQKGARRPAVPRK